LADDSSVTLNRGKAQAEQAGSLSFGHPWFECFDYLLVQG
jgi:hypothetical protein